MATLVYNTGFEYGLATPVINGSGLFTTVTGSPVIDATAALHGNYGLHIQVTGTAASEYVGKTLFTTGDNIIVGRFYFKFAVWPSAKVELVMLTVAAGGALRFYIDTSHRIAANISPAEQVSAALSLNTLYRLDFRANFSSNPCVCDWQIDGSAQTQVSQAQSATNFADWRMGWIQTAIGEVYIDSVALSKTSGDYPIGAGGCEGLRPDSDGTHNNATDVLEDASGADIDGSTVFAYAQLDRLPWDTAITERVQQNGNGASNYVEVNFANTSQTLINGARAILQYRAATATADTGGCIIIDEDTTQTTLWGASGALADYSESSMFYKSVQLPTPAGGWDQGAVNAIISRLGYSDDANPDPYWVGLILEVDYIEFTGVTINLSAAALAASPQALSITKGAVTKNISAAALTASPQAFGVQPGAVSKDMASALLAASPQVFDVQPGAVSKDLLAATLLVLAQTITISAGGGPTTVNLSAAIASTLAQILDVQPGAVSKDMSSALLAASPQTLDVQPGAVSKALSSALMSADPQIIDPQPGAVSKAMSSAILTASPQVMDVQQGEMIKVLASALLNSSPQTLDVQPGAVSLLLNNALISLLAQTITISIVSGIVVNLNVTGISAGGQALVVQEGAVSVNLAAALLTALAQQSTLVKGEATIQLANAQINANAQQTTTLSDIILNLATGNLVAGAQPITIVSGVLGLALYATFKGMYRGAGRKMR